MIIYHLHRCFVGKRNLEIAIRESKLMSVKVLWEPYFLSRDISVEGEDLVAHITKKYGADATKRMMMPDNPLSLAGNIWHVCNKYILKVVCFVCKEIVLVYHLTVQEELCVPMIVIVLWNGVIKLTLSSLIS